MQNIDITIPHLEGIDQTAKNFGLSPYRVRRLARGQYAHLFVVKIGNRYLINQQKLAAFLNCEAQEQAVPAAPAQSAGVIRPVPVRL